MSADHGGPRPAEQPGVGSGSLINRPLDQSLVFAFRNFIYNPFIKSLKHTSARGETGGEDSLHHTLRGAEVL